MNIHSMCGQRFGTLTAVRRADRGNQVRFACKCDCGKEHNVSARELLAGTFRCDCGLMTAEQAMVRPPEAAILRTVDNATVKLAQRVTRKRGK